MKLEKFFIAYLGIVIPLLVTLLAASTLSLYVKDAESGGSYGEISLRSYFEKGNGKKPYDEEDPDTSPGDYPFVITRPLHMYNLSRLQSLGVFDEHTYFQLGLDDLDGVAGGPALCWADDNTTSNTVRYLDMTGSTYDNERIIAIGSESTPFYGDFDGQNVEIRNLTVFADPEDAGLFGYTAQGSKVHDLFLNNVTINTLGYTSTYASLYGEGSAASQNVALDYLRPVADDGGSGSSSSSASGSAEDNDVHISFSPTSGLDDDFDFDDDEFAAYLNWYEHRLDQSPPAKPTITHSAATISMHLPNNMPFHYKLLNSGGFLDGGGEEDSVLNLESVFQFFAEAIADAEPGKSIQASSSVSLVASMTDSYGLNHSKVIMTLVLLFTLDDPAETTINMQVSVGEEHGNNIGLIIGHCDGSVNNCYAYKGKFVMNMNNNPDPEVEVEAGYNPLANGSNLGLIGLVGNAVHNIVAENSETSSEAGKDVGVLDFTTMYKKIIDEDSFVGSTAGQYGGVTFNPVEGNDYEEYLRYYGNNPKTYITSGTDQVAFRGQKVIKNEDLGIFTIATDGATDGIGASSGQYLDLSMMKKEDVSITNAHYDITNAYYLYYATGEYHSGGGISFADYRNSFDSDQPTKFLLGHHLPTFKEEEIDDEVVYKSEMTYSTWAEREMHQNYFFRFKLEPGYRANRGFYFSDLDENTAGGVFMRNYFHYKLVDQNGFSIPAGTKRSGIMLRDNTGREVRSFSASFTTPDSDKDGYRGRMFCIDSANVVDEHGTRLHPASNMVNFKIKTAAANVTVVAAPESNDRPAALGIYRIDGKTPNDDNGTVGLHYDQNYDDPDYAFFMPKAERLAYFDYKVDGDRKGQIGTYDHTGTFRKATSSTNATMPSAHVLHNAPESEYAYESGKPRLFVHTFRLPEGEYCIGSATGKTTKTSENQDLGVAKLYYVCAQGQDEGQWSLNGNVFEGGDEVDNVDFLKTARFAANGTEQIQIRDTSDQYMKPGEESYLDNQRCYVTFNNLDRSLFLGTYADLLFTYVPGEEEGDDDVFVISSSTMSAISHVSVNNYLKNHWQGQNNTFVQLFSASPSQESALVYDAPG